MSAAAVLFASHAKIRIGTTTGIVPICRMPRISAHRLNRPAPGMPATIRPMPINSDCSSETPITPRARLRIVTLVRCMNSSPCVASTWRTTARALSASAGPGTNRNPDSATAITKLSMLIPELPANDNSVPANGLSSGPICRITASRLVEACCHSANNWPPISGQFFTAACGGGIGMSPAWSRCANPRMLSIRLSDSQAIGPNSTARLAAVISKAAAIGGSRSRFVHQTKPG